MLPPAPKDVGRLSHVFGSALAAVGGNTENRLRLAKASHSVVVLIDGLGWHNLQDAKAYARFLSSRQLDSIRCEFPSTTATSLTGLATGERSGSHGMIGYSVFKRSNQKPMNLLTGWGSVDEAKGFKKVKSLSEAVENVAVRVIGPSVYKDSGFSAITMPNVNYVVADSISERFAKALRVPSQNSVTYLYVPELDQLAHKFGVSSTKWLDALEEVDGELSKFNSQLPSNFGVLVTADHGVIDVPSENHVFLDEFDWYVDSVLHTAGDPRCNFVYLSEGVDSAAFTLALKHQFGASAYVCDSSELKISGWADWTTPTTSEVAPDLVIIWNGNAVAYDRRVAKPQYLKMIGQHGGISDQETRIPLIKLGCF